MSKSNQNWFTFQNATKDKPAKLIIEGDIGDWGISSASFRSQMSRIGEKEPLSVHVVSGGGSVSAGQEIANQIRGHKGEVTVTCGSIVASIATVIMLAGKRIIAAKNSIFMIHRVTAFAAGDAAELRKTAETMEKFEQGILAAYVKKTGKTEEELSADMEAETWMTAEEALAYGLIDEIADEDDKDDDVIDNIDLKHYANASRLLELRLQNAGDTAKLLAGNGGKLTLAGIKNSIAANKPQPPQKPPTNLNVKPNTMTPEEIAAQQAKEQKAIADGVKAAMAAQKTRRIEVLAMVTQARKRTSCDFTDEAEEFLNTDNPAADFSMVILNSDKKPAVIGSGLEVIEPLDQYKGTPGFQFVNSEQFRALGEQIKRGGRRPQGGVQVQQEIAQFRNTTHTSTATSGSGLTSIEKLPGVVTLGVRPLALETLIAGGATGNTTVRYIQEVSYTQAAAAVLEQGTLATVQVTYNEVDAPVKDIGGLLKMSENLLADYPAVAAFINERLPYQVDRAVDDQLMNGSGSGANLTGILNTSGIQTLAKGSNTISDLALKLQTLVRWQNMSSGAAQGGFEPDGYVIHPTDWESYQLAKDANGQYLMRGPFYVAYGNGTTVEFYTLWGKPVAVSPVTAQGTIVCGAWRMGAQKFDRQGLIIEMTNSDGTDFQTRTVTVRGTRRLALCVYRPGSFVTGTGL